MPVTVDGAAVYSIGCVYLFDVCLLPCIGVLSDMIIINIQHRLPCASRLLVLDDIFHSGLDRLVHIDNLDHHLIDVHRHAPRAQLQIVLWVLVLVLARSARYVIVPHPRIRDPVVPAGYDANVQVDRDRSK